MNRAQTLLEAAVVEVANAMPDDWQRAFARIEVASDGSGGTSSLLCEPRAARGTLVPVAGGDEVLARFQALWAEMRMTADPWTTATLVVDRTGRFDIQHGYAPLTSEPPLTRRARWIQALAQTYGVAVTG